MSEHAEQELRQLMLQLIYGDYARESEKEDVSKREIIVTPFDGCYGRAGVVITLNGSPVRCVIVSLDTYGLSMFPNMFSMQFQGRSRRLGNRQCEVVWKYLVAREVVSETRG